MAKLKIQKTHANFEEIVEHWSGVRVKCIHVKIEPNELSAVCRYWDKYLRKNGWGMGTRTDMPDYVVLKKSSKEVRYV